MAVVRGLLHAVEWRRVGFWVWLVRRFSGLGIALYLLLHIVVIYQLVGGRATFDEVMRLFATPVFRLGELLVVVACLIHAIDGTRIMVIEAFDLARAERRLLWATAAIAAVAVLAAGTPLFLYLLGVRVLP